MPKTQPNPLMNGQVDVSINYFETEDKRVTLLDAPGHRCGRECVRACVWREERR